MTDGLLPNTSDADEIGMSDIDTGHLLVLQDADAGIGFRSGYAVSVAVDDDDLEITVGPGELWNGESTDSDTVLTVTTGSGLTAGYGRRDLIVIDVATGVPELIDGTASEYDVPTGVVPVLPDKPATKVYRGDYFMLAGETTVLAARVNAGAKPIQRPNLPTVPAGSAAYNLDSAAWELATTSAAWNGISNWNMGMQPSTVWFKPRGRRLRPGDVIRIQPRLTILATATTNQPMYFRPIIVNPASGAFLRMAGLATTFGVANWRLSPGTTIGAHEAKIGTPYLHRVRADEIDDSGGIFVDLQYSVNHTAGTYTIIQSSFFGAYEPAGILVDGPFEVIDGTALVFTGQSLGNNVGDGQFSDIYPRRVVDTLVGDGYELGWWKNNASGTRYDQRDGWHLLTAAAALRYRRVVVIDDGGSSDIANGEDASTVIGEMEAYADACRGVAPAGVVSFARLTIPDTDLFDGSADTVRATVNAAILADANSKYDAVVDLEDWDSDFGDYTSGLFNDNTHFTIAGHTAAAAAVVDAITPLLL